MPAVLQQSCRCRGRLDNGDNLLCALLAWLRTIACHYRVAPGRRDTRGGSISTLFRSGHIESSGFVGLSFLFTSVLRLLRCHYGYYKGKKLLYIRRSCLGDDLVECLGLQEFYVLMHDRHWRQWTHLHVTITMQRPLRKPQTHSDMGWGL